MPSIRDVPERVRPDGLPTPFVRVIESQQQPISDDSIDTQTVPSAAEIVVALTSPDTSPTEFRQMILMAELTSFDESRAAIVRPFLQQYVVGHYSTEHRDEFIAVASAVRQSVASLSGTELPQVVCWLEANRKSPPAFEMEVVRSIRRKLAETPPDDTTGMEPLGDLLIDIFEGYSTPRMLPKRYCGATALDAAISLALLGGPRFSRLVEGLRRSQVGWFRSLVARQAEALRIDIMQGRWERIAAADRLAEVVVACEPTTETAE